MTRVHRGAFLAALSLFYATGSSAAAATLPDEAILAYATAPYDKVAASHVTLGMHHDAVMVAEFICSDLCPAYTVRVVHYELPKGKSCASIGGVERIVQIPVSIAATDKAFCFPKIIADNWDQYTAAAHIRE